MVFLIVFGVILLVVILYVVMVYNSLARINVLVGSSFLKIDEYFMKKQVVIKKIKNQLEGFKDVSKKTFKEINLILEENYMAKDIASKIEYNEKMNIEIKELIAINKNKLFLHEDNTIKILTNELKSIDNLIDEEKENYNYIVRSFNTMLTMFPRKIVAKMFKFKKFEYYHSAKENYL